MKRILLIMLFFSLVFSCTKESVDSNRENLDKSISLNEDNTVSLFQIESIINKSFPCTKNGERVEYTISPVLSDSGDTLLYVVNSNSNGWRIYSADSRTPAILAESDRGAFSLDDGNGAHLAWFDCLKTDMAIIRHSCNEQLSFSEDEISANKAFWSGETPRIELPPETPWPGGGHWEVIVTSETFVTDTLSHMAPKWDQNEPYNVYCPYLTLGGGHVPAGCVAVAGAQVLYYLHNKLGTPSLAFSQAFCYGVPHNYYQEFFNLSSSVWALMDSTNHDIYDPADEEAILIAHVGSLVNMVYEDDGSSADDYKIYSTAFPTYGISCSREGYNESTVKQQLEDRMPVMVSAYSQLLFGSGHCFVIDGFKKTYIKYTYNHVFVGDDPGMSVPEPYETYSYTTPEITAIKINWGWSSQWDENSPLNDGWYTLTGDWHVSLSGEEKSYNYYRTMNYGFEVI